MNIRISNGLIIINGIVRPTPEDYERWEAAERADVLAEIDSFKSSYEKSDNQFEIEF